MGGVIWSDFLCAQKNTQCAQTLRLGSHGVICPCILVCKTCVLRTKKGVQKLHLKCLMDVYVLRVVLMLYMTCKTRINPIGWGLYTSLKVVKSAADIRGCPLDYSIYFLRDYSLRLQLWYTSPFPGYTSSLTNDNSETAILCNHKSFYLYT